MMHLNPYKIKIFQQNNNGGKLREKDNKMNCTIYPSKYLAKGGYKPTSK